ncbi:MAG: hypothetical protein LW834_17160 [Cyanobium sp. 49614_E6]|jgi:hypothetical protein|nr:hypothetical protein [Cyanobium sp. 49614_E6]
MPPLPSDPSSQPGLPGKTSEIDWISTEKMCLDLDICRSTLYRVRTDDERMKQGSHYIRKNPTSVKCGHLLWNPEKVREIFGRQGQ